MNDKYKNIINMKYPYPTSHKKMTIYNRSAQFAPFAALTGYEDSIQEEGRTTTKYHHLSIDEQLVIENKLNLLNINLSLNPQITITYFIKDKTKSGGEYQTITTTIKKIDNINQELILTNKEKISFNNLINLESKDINLEES